MLLSSSLLENSVKLMVRSSFAGGGFSDYGSFSGVVPSAPILAACRMGA
jgi:hypothetical protein